jgi:hypothetical protein
MRDPIAFVKKHGVVLASGRGPVPSVAETIAGSPIRGSWWAHEKGREIFRALSEIADSRDVLCFRLVGGKLTFVHRRLWPALVVLADELGRARLTAIRQQHTASGAHRNVETRFPAWVPAVTKKAARSLTVEKARTLLAGL